MRLVAAALTLIFAPLLPGQKINLYLSDGGDITVKARILVVEDQLELQELG